MINLKQVEKGYPGAIAHAKEVFPEESVGFIVDGQYIPVENIAGDPKDHQEGNDECNCRLCCFQVKPSDTSKYLKKAQMLIHSHPNGVRFPSKADMKGQINTNIPWGIICLDQSQVFPVEAWGDGLPIPPLIGRQFMHGVRDCYSIIRDAYAVGREGMVEQGVTNHWPLDPIQLDQVERRDGWWEKGEDMYGTIPFQIGWEEIKLHEAKPGDVFLVKIKSDKFNHGGLLVSNDLIMHHLPSRLSRREPSGAWARTAGMWLRYVGK